jgi:bifunctional UDP-N-acetylglucosamine pyrophosphorylase/glucosamine-1-phosphate N-acetyltransferase
MQAVILAAGKSTRTYPLTLTKPKPLLKAANKTLIEHNIDNLLGTVDEAIIVVGYKKNIIKKFLGKKYKNIKITYVGQKQQLGTGHAVSIVERRIKNRFLLLMGDDIYSKEDIRKCAKFRYSILATKSKNWKNFGVVVEKNGLLIDFAEKPKRFVSDLINAALYSLDKEIFKCLYQIKKSKRNEYELPDAVKLLSKNESIHCVKTKNWMPIGYPWDLLKADRILRKGRNVIGRNSRIDGTVRNSSIGNNCVIKGNISNSIVMDNSTIDKGSVVEESVIGSNVYFKGKILAKSNAFSMVKGKKIKTGKLGAVIADNVKAKNVTVNAGCKIWPNKKISNKTISKDMG